MIYPEDKLIAAIDRNTEAIERAAYQRTADIRNAAEVISACIAVAGGAIWVVLFFIMLTIICRPGKAAPLISDGDEIASVGTEVQR